MGEEDGVWGFRREKRKAFISSGFYLGVLGANGDSER